MSFPLWTQQLQAFSLQLRGAWSLVHAAELALVCACEQKHLWGYSQ